MTPAAVYYLSPCAVAFTRRDGTAGELLFGTRNEAEAFVALIPFTEADIATAMLRPSGMGVN